MTSKPEQAERTRIEEIIWCEGQADQMVAEAEDLRWDAARLITEELATGKLQREVAAEIGKSQSHVSFMAQVHRLRPDYPGNKTAPRAFGSYYEEVQRQQADTAGREERKRKVRELADEGVSGRAIGKKLGIDEKTVRGDLKGYLSDEEPPAPASDCAFDPIAMSLAHFKDDTRALLTSRRTKENIEDYRRVKKAADAFMTALQKIGRDHHNEP